MKLVSKIVSRAILLAPLMLAGCGGLIGPEKAPQLYRLNPHTGPAKDAAKDAVHWQLAVGLPNADAVHDSDRIALSLTPTTLDYYANAAWPDRVPVLIQRQLVQAFEDTGRVPAVARDSAGLGADYILQTELRAFEARYDDPPGTDEKNRAAPRIVISIGVKLVTQAERRIIGTTSIREEVPASANTVEAASQAFSTALTPALKKIVDWTLATAPP